MKSRSRGALGILLAVVCVLSANAGVILQTGFDSSEGWQDGYVTNTPGNPAVGTWYSSPFQEITLVEVGQLLPLHAAFGRRDALQHPAAGAQQRVWSGEH